jgi:hypothetical protein
MAKLILDLGLQATVFEVKLVDFRVGSRGAYSGGSSGSECPC